MKKSTKVIATIVAVVLVVTAMVVAIYAATAGNVGINANVSWTAQEGVNLEFWATATGGDQEKSVAKSTIAPTTTNVNAKIQGDLSCNFKDDSNDGVNNPEAITFKYYVKNNSLTPLNIRVTKTPEAGAESGTSASNHKPKIVLASTIGSNNVLANALGTSGCELTAGETFEYSVVLSMASGGTGTIDANTGLMKDFDAGVNFLFNVAGSSSSANTIKTVVDGVETSTPIGDVAGQTLGEFLATKEPEISTGWFFDEGLTQVVTQENLNAPLRADAETTNLYTMEASTTGLTFALNSDGNSYAVSSNGATGELIIPNKYNGKYVTRIGEKAFSNNQNITSVVLPNSILGISVDSVSSTINASNIVNTSVIHNIKGPEIDNDVFYGAFEFCTKLTKIAIPDSVTSIGDSAFSNCSGLTSIIIPNSVTSIGEFAFEYCDGLTSIAIPDGVTSLGDSAFSECSGLTSITIPDSVTSIGSSAFSYCRGLTNITLGNGLTSIGGGTFSGCSGLTSITIPNSVTSIGEFAFEYCDGLTSIAIPDSVTSLGDNTFANCTALTKVFIPESVEMVTSSMFNFCSSTLIIYCEASSQPDGWEERWYYIYTDENSGEEYELEVYWGVTRAEFDAL